MPTSGAKATEVAAGQKATDVAASKPAPETEGSPSETEASEVSEVQTEGNGEIETEFQGGCI